MSKETVFMKDCIPQFHPTLSNDKLGGKKFNIMGISYVPGNTFFYLKDGTLVSDCPGTCNNVDCSGCGKRGICYAIDSYCQYPAVTLNRVENTIQLRLNPEKHFQDIKQSIIDNKINTVRYTESGEIIDYAHFERIINLCNDLKSVNFYLYTKNYKVLYTYFSKYDDLPENLVILISIWKETGVKEYNDFKDHKNIKAFVVNNPDIKVQAMCPAYKEINGKVVRIKTDNVKCGNCGLCTAKSNCKVIGCIEH